MTTHNKTDRELLELAAKAIGKRYPVHRDAGTNGRVDLVPWNPLTDDGDALRLAVRLRLSLNREFNAGDDIVETFGPEQDDMSCHCSTESIGADPYSATRRAIVRAAAAIGEAMP